MPNLRCLMLNAMHMINKQACKIPAKTKGESVSLPCGAYIVPLTYKVDRPCCPIHPRPHHEGIYEYG